MLKKHIKGIPPKKQLPVAPRLSDELNSVTVLITDLQNVRKQVVDVVDSKIEEVDAFLGGAKKQTEDTDKVAAKMLENFESTAIELIGAIQNLPQIEGKPGKNADQVDQKKLIADIIKALPHLSPDFEAKILARIPKVSEAAIVKKLFNLLPKNVKELEDKAEEDDLTPEDVIKAILELSAKDFQLTTAHIKGLDAELAGLRHTVATRFGSDNKSSKGYVHGGGDTVTAGNNITLVRNANGTVTINATGGGAVDSVFGRTGAVTAQAGDYTTAIVADSTNKRYVTDANLVVIGNTSGTNTGDNAVNTLYSGLVSNATHTGDASGATVLTLATVNSNVGSFGTAANVGTFTVNAKGLITAASNTAIQIAESQVTGLVADLVLKAPLASPTFTGTVTLPAGQVVNGVTLSTAAGAGNFLRGDGTYAAPSGGGDMVLASAQTNTGVKTFLDGTMGLRNVANTFTSFFTNTNTAARTYTLKDGNGTLAFTSDITGTNSGTNTGDVTLAGAPNYITIAGQVITRSLIDLTSHVTGLLPFANIANVATSTVMYRKTAGTGTIEAQPLGTLKTDLGLTGTNTGDQTITLTGDVTGSGTGTFAATIAANAVTYAKIQNTSVASVLIGRGAGAGAGVVQEITLGSGLTLTGTVLSASGGGGGSSWNLAGNAGTTPGTDFIGTTDFADLVFKRNNQICGLITAAVGTSNVGFGDGLFAALTTGSSNAALGSFALNALTSGTSNTSVGYNSSKVIDTGSYNTVMGSLALFQANSITASHNTALGGLAGFNITTGGSNTMIGDSAGTSVDVGSGNTMIGANVAAAANTSNNVIIGDGTGAKRFWSDATGNTIVGKGTLAAPVVAFEIQSNVAGTSGARFTNLTSASAAGASSGKVLSVDASGNIVLETAGGGGGGSPGGTNKQLQFNNSGVFAGSILEYTLSGVGGTAQFVIPTQVNANTAGEEIYLASATGNGTGAGGWIEMQAGNSGAGGAGAYMALMGANGSNGGGVQISGGNTGANADINLYTPNGMTGVRGSAGFTAKLDATGLGTNRTYAFPNNSGTFALGGGTVTGTSSGTNTGDQTITLTGDVTGSGAASFATTIANNAVTLAKMATVATGTILGRTTAATGNVEVLTSLPFAFTGDVTRAANSNATVIANAAVTYAKMQNVSSASRLLGRGSAGGAGSPEELTIGSGLSLSGTTLSASGGSSITNINLGSLVYADGSVPGGNTVANTTTETALTSSYTIPAGSLVAGNVIRLRVSGLYSTNVVAPNITAKIKIGSVIVATTGSITAVAAVTNGGYTGFLDLIVTNAGASGVVESQGFLEFATAATTALTVNLSNTAATSGIDFTVAQAITVTIQWSAASASNTLTMRQMEVDINKIAASTSTVTSLGLVNMVRLGAAF